MTPFALLLHLLAVAFWVGGMGFAYVALRPALAETLEPPQRLVLFERVMRRFLAGVLIAIVVLLASGGYLFMTLPAARPAIHVMTTVGLVMIVVFGYIRLRAYPAMCRAIAAKAWPVAGAAAAVIGRLVALNLVLGIATIAVAVVWR